MQTIGGSINLKIKDCIFENTLPHLIHTENNLKQIFYFNSTQP